ncbi:hypothetical protein NDU88_005970 [Pleurodeles waltl]|uniref:Uncharacterized protein n=1 Tax=Pleurodeles waltl TaxID=8319 RepID=A0AAV7NRX5_PLEWA|nr:hypothetical protein NDU88_005969 [Pleurodeles waltl]KAJ1117774.1 hypothetical protein NDU88_005970 [Pleurodeles waltl]
MRLWPPRSGLQVAAPSPGRYLLLIRAPANIRPRPSTSHHLPPTASDVGLHLPNLNARPGPRAPGRRNHCSTPSVATNRRLSRPGPSNTPRCVAKGQPNIRLPHLCRVSTPNKAVGTGTSREGRI